MPYKLNQQQMEAVAKLEPADRYAHFLARVGDWQELWTLKGPGGIVGMGDAEGIEGIPFWPHPLYAEWHAQGEWSNCEATRISAEDFTAKWLVGMARDGVRAVVFPTPSLKGLVLDPSRVREDVRKELAQYE